MSSSDTATRLDLPQLGPDGRLVRCLIAYFGLWQTIHILVNLRALARFKRGDETFPAHPPADGWDAPTQATMEAMAKIDTIAALVTLGFVIEYERDGERWPLLGTLALTIANYSAVIFAYPTRAAGAWEEHPVAYWGLYLSYHPIVVLTVLYAWWMSRERLSLSESV